MVEQCVVRRFSKGERNTVQASNQIKRASTCSTQFDEEKMLPMDFMQPWNLRISTDSQLQGSCHNLPAALEVSIYTVDPTICKSDIPHSFFTGRKFHHAMINRNKTLRAHEFPELSRSVVAMYALHSSSMTSALSHVVLCKTSTY